MEVPSWYHEYIAAKRVKKYHQIMEYVYHIIDNKSKKMYWFTNEYDEENVRKFICNDECTQIAVSICLKSLSRSRADEICEKVLPNHDMTTIVDQSYAEGNVPYEHTVYGYDMYSEKVDMYRKVMERFTFSHEDVKGVLNEMTIIELANIVPKIEHVTYVHVTARIYT